MNKAFLPAAHWNILTPLYEGIFRPISGPIWRRVAETVSSRAEENGTVVDLGCGPATVLRLLRKMRNDLKLTGVDIDPEMLRVAERKSQSQNIELENSSIDETLLQSHSVDVAYSSLMFHHLNEDVKRRTLKEVERILKQGKPFLLCDFSVPTSKVMGAIVRPLAWLEPEVGSQLDGQLLRVGAEAGAKLNTLWTMNGCISMHEFYFPNL